LGRPLRTSNHPARPAWLVLHADQRLKQHLLPFERLAATHLDDDDILHRGVESLSKRCPRGAPARVRSRYGTVHMLNVRVGEPLRCAFRGESAAADRHVRLRQSNQALEPVPALTGHVHPHHERKAGVSNRRTEDDTRPWLVTDHDVEWLTLEQL